MNKKIQIIIAFLCGVLVCIGFITAKDWFLASHQVMPTAKEEIAVEKPTFEKMESPRKITVPEKHYNIKKLQKSFF